MADSGGSSQGSLNVSEDDNVLMEVLDPPTLELEVEIISSSPPPRPKVYQDNTTGPFVVFFRPIKKPLNVLQITKDLTERFSDVILVKKIRLDKLRVTVGSLKQANEIVKYELFTREYRVYIPCCDVEIDGVVSDASLTCKDILDDGVGRFKNPSLQDVEILECRKLSRPSDSYRVTFAGTALPQSIAIGKALFPVRLFTPRVMNCLRCKRLGHTASHCSNKARCGKCGEPHEDDSCQSNAPKCIYCGEETSHELSTCPEYKLRSDKLKRSLKERSKRSFAEMLKKAAPPASQNPFALLSGRETDDDVLDEGITSVPQGSTRKRTISSPKRTRKEPKISQVEMQTKKRSVDDKNPKQVAPGLRNANYDQQFPPLPGTSKTPNVPFLPSENQSHSGLFAFSDIVEKILNALNISDPLRSIITALLPTLKTFLQQLTVQWPIISAIISFDD